MYFGPLFSAVFLDISVMRSEVCLASLACPPGTIQTHRWHAPYLLGIAIMSGTNSWCWLSFQAKWFFLFWCGGCVAQDIHSHSSWLLVKAQGLFHLVSRDDLTSSIACADLTFFAMREIFKSYFENRNAFLYFLKNKTLLMFCPYQDVKLMQVQLKKLTIK